jgi:hypothetical protein
MEITSYNHHLKAPFFPVVFVVKQRILCRTGPSLLSNQSLRFLQEPALSLSKGWVAMLRVLFDLLWTPDQIHLVLAFPAPAFRKECEGQGTHYVGNASQIKSPNQHSKKSTH